MSVADAPNEAYPYGGGGILAWVLEERGESACDGDWSGPLRCILAPLK